MERRFRAACGTLGLVGLALCLAIADRGVVAAAPGNGMTSPMVDTTLYRDGEVRRMSGTFGRWLVVCDEIAKLKQRYCSLKTAIVDEATRIVGVIDVSTGDNGQPAALVHLPLGVLVQPGLDIRFPGPAATPAKSGKGTVPPLVRHLAILSCDEKECFALWNLTSAEIAGLRQDKAVAIRFQIGRLADGLPSLEPPTTIEASVSPAGFSAAIKASLQ